MGKATLPMEERMRHAKAQIESGVSQEKYAESVGLKPSTIAYWVKQYHDMYGGGTKRKKSETPTITTAITHDALGDARQEIMSLIHVRDDLLARLEDAHIKIKSLQNVVIVLGHQAGDE
jgi:transposase-like protein